MEDNLTPERVRPMWARNLLSGLYKQRPHRLCTMQVRDADGSWRDATDDENQAISDWTYAGERRMLNCQLGVLWITINQALADDPDDGVSGESCFEWVPGVGWVAEDSAIFPPVWAMRAAGLGMIERGDGKFYPPSQPETRASAVNIGGIPFDKAAEWVNPAGLTMVPFDRLLDATTNEMLESASLVGKDPDMIGAAAQASSGCEPFDEVAWASAPFQPLPPERREAMVANAGVTPFDQVADPLFDPAPGQPVLRLSSEDRRMCDGAGRATAGAEPFSDVAALHLRHVALIDDARA